jgi:hypothetical protein
MSNVKISAVVNRSDGELFYKGSHEWNGLDADGVTMFKDRLTKASDRMRDLHGRHKSADGANLTATLTGSIDDVPIPSVSQTGVSYRTVLEAEKHAANLLNDLLDVGEKVHAPKHAKRHGKP